VGRSVCAPHGIIQQPFLLPAIGSWLVGLVALFSINFGVGNLLLGQTIHGVGLLLLGAAALWWVMKRTRAQAG
jgi:hypothetical protein